MLKIIPKGNRARLVGDIPDEVEEQLQQEFMWVSPLDLEDVDYFYRRKFMRSGMMFAVADRLTQLGYHTDIELENVPSSEFPEWKFKYKYKPLQEPAVDALIKFRYGILKAPPGVGKTVMASGVITKIGHKAAILVEQKEPFKQAYKTLKKATTIGHVGRVDGTHKDVGDVTVFMIQALHNALKNDPDGPIVQAFRECTVIIIDECHHAASERYAVALDSARSAKYILGFSATPHRDDDKHDYLEAYIGPVVHEITYAEAIDHKILCPCTIEVVPVPERKFGYVGKNGPVSKNPFEVKRQFTKVVKEYLFYNQSRTQIAIDYARDAMRAGLSVALLVSKTDHGDYVHSLMPEAEYVHGKSPKKYRERIFGSDDRVGDLQTKKVMAVITTLMDEAVDIPSLGAVVLMGGGKSSVKLIQRIRSLRTFEGDTELGYYEKDRGYVLYLKDQADFLRSHSTECIRLLKELVREHPSNEIVIHE